MTAVQGIHQLIPIQVSRVEGETVQTVDARSLHLYLEIKSEFRNWIKNRIDDYGFLENKDFVTTVEIYRGGERKDYHISLDMAKELAMVERNEKGKEARQYFIECERKAKPLDYSSPEVMLGVLTHLQSTVQSQREQLAIMAPKAAAMDRLDSAEGSFCITDAAKQLKVMPKKLFDYLQLNKWIYKRIGTSAFVGYQEKVATGYLEHKTATFTKPDGTEKATLQVRITPKGMIRLSRAFEAPAQGGLLQ